MITINPAPLMTRFLVGETETFKDDPFVVIDVGARGGLAPHWAVLEPHLKAYCFEPDEAECARMQAGAPPHITYIPKALAAEVGKKTLYVTALADSAGLCKTNMEYFSRLVNAANGVTVAEREIDCTTLEECLALGDIPNPDFLKIDAEGGEWDVWCGAGGHAKPLGLITEIRFHHEINGCPPFHIVDEGLQDDGFRLYDLSFHYQSRKDLPYPQRQRVLTQEGRLFMGVTTRGQIQDGDALYFRDLLLPHGKPATADMSAVQILKMACLMEIYSLNDCAAELIRSSPMSSFISNASGMPNLERCLDLLASGIAGESVTYETYCERYFS